MKTEPVLKSCDSLQRLPWKSLSFADAGTFPKWQTWLVPATSSVVRERLVWESRRNDLLASYESVPLPGVSPHWTLRCSPNQDGLLCLAHRSRVNLTLFSPPSAQSVCARVIHQGKSVLFHCKEGMPPLFVFSSMGSGLLIENQHNPPKFTSFSFESTEGFCFEGGHKLTHGFPQLAPVLSLLKDQPDSDFKESLRNALWGGDLWEQVAAAGELFRFQVTPNKGKNEWVSSLLRGEQSQFEVPLLLAESWSQLQLDALRGAALFVCEQLQFLLSTIQRVSEPILQRVFEDYCLQRDRLESALRVMAQSSSLKNSAFLWDRVAHLDETALHQFSPFGTSLSFSDPLLERESAIRGALWYPHASSGLQKDLEASVVSAATTLLQTPQWNKLHKKQK